MSKVKQILVVRKDLKMTKGKIIAQCSHASLGVILQMMDKTITEEGEVRTLDIHKGSNLDNWINGIFTKVCVYVESEEDLIDIYNKAKLNNLPVVLIEDSGLTMFNGVKTKTCLAIGPCESEKIDAITGSLRLL